MITIKFPALDKALLKDLKDLPDNDPRRGIIVLNNNAIVLRDNFCLVCDLYEYFTIEKGIDDPNELEELDRILFFMDSKIFGVEFWKELTKGANMKMNNGTLYVDTPKYSKNLHYKEVDVNFLEPLSKIREVSYQESSMVDSISVPFGALNLIYSCLSADFKMDKIIFEFNSQDKPVKFTFKDRKHFYGFIYPDYDAIQEGFRFDILEQFT